tara:strand:+ start:113 stop:1096 length:984 start_codon:yes stop_codon:yes gene_type:complete
MAFKMKNPSMAKLTKAAGSNRAAMKMKMESAAKMKKESAMKKELVGKQGNLPPELKAKIEAAPSKMKKASPAKLKEPMAPNYFKREEGKNKASRQGLKKSRVFKGGKKKPTPAEIERFNKSLPKLVEKASPAGAKMKKDSPVKLKDENKKAKLQSELDKVNDKIEAVIRTKDVNTLMDERAKKVAERRGLTRTQIIEGYLSPLQDKKDSLRNEIKNASNMKSGVKMVKAVRKKQTENKIEKPGKKSKTTKVIDGSSKMAKKAKADYEKDQAKKKAKADKKAEFKRVEQENLKVSRMRAKNLGMTMKEYEKHLRSKMLKSQRKRIFGF